ncbi:hypothetical protein IKE79_01000 [Candidatus Saccharibacteria bacterium]|nr:hypothetical protein [Candidatus Saccharibacteria bacterium]
MDGGIVTFIIAVIIIAAFVLVAMMLTAKRAHKFNVEEYQARFLAIENRLNKENVATYVVAVIDGDKLLDKAMMEAGIPGKTMGDRLKRSGTRFSDINAVWRAHKLRNAISHESDMEVGYKQAANALAVYKQALKDIGAI